MSLSHTTVKTKSRGAENTDQTVYNRSSQRVSEISHVFTHADITENQKLQFLVVWSKRVHRVTADRLSKRQILWLYIVSGNWFLPRLHPC